MSFVRSFIVPLNILGFSVILAVGVPTTGMAQIVMDAPTTIPMSSAPTPDSLKAVYAFVTKEKPVIQIDDNKKATLEDLLKVPRDSIISIRFTAYKSFEDAYKSSKEEFPELNQKPPKETYGEEIVKGLIYVYTTASRNAKKKAE